MGAQGVPGAGLPKEMCRYGQKCTRLECWYAHPEGRDIDGTRTDPVFFGKVKFYNPDKGCGIMDSPEAKKVIGEDVIFLWSELNGVVPDKGDTCQFRLGSKKRYTKPSNKGMVTHN